MDTEHPVHHHRLPLTDTLNSLPPEWPHDSLPAIRSAMRQRGDKVAVLDDDPTGCQTIHGIPVLTDWSVESIVSELNNDLPTFFLLTNSRSLPLPEAQRLNAEIGHNLMEASRGVGRGLVVVSRSDSTLRGHFPGEVDALAQALRQDFDAVLLAPFFKEGGRYTINNVHYVADGEWLVPAGETEFAGDAAFGYHASDLRQWVEEKTNGNILSDAVHSISIEDIRVGGPERVARRLAGLPHGSVCIINAASMRDLEVLVQGLLAAEGRGQRFLYRTAASFVRARSGLSPRPLLTQGDLDLPASGGGLAVIGSHVPRTTSQLTHVLEHTGVVGIEVHVRRLLDELRWSDEAKRVAEQADECLDGDNDVVVFTGRHVVTGDDAKSSLSIGQRISDGMVAIVLAITQRPRYILAKGGITASDIATKALGVKRAMVLGQVLPGVPVWELGEESRYPGLKLIVFPGNVGGPDALTEVVTGLRPGA